jgi:PST family polysaccharide transporter
LQNVLANTGWLFADKILRMGVGLVVSVWVARYLGPSQFGLWNYAIAFASLFGALATLGLDSIVIRELVKNPERQNEVLGSAFALKLIGGTITLAIAILASILPARRAARLHPVQALRHE